WKRKRVSRTGGRCGAAFEVKQSKVDEGAAKFCSQGCYDAARAQRFAALTCEQCGGDFSLPESHLGPNMYQGRYCSLFCGSMARRLPDAVRSEYDHEFTEALKERIRKRDGHTCRVCGIHTSETSRRLDVHHIDYNKTNNDPLNLTALCRSCHSKTNYDRERWQRYFFSKPKRYTAAVPLSNI
ncbi:MAG: HNH endonuclease signature motif containing protein, partial [Gammaproteobacteria bacterium]